MNLLIVESPLQLLCAFEAIKTFSQHPYTLLIRLTGRGNNDAQMLQCADFLQLEYQTFKIYPNQSKLHFLMNSPLWLSLLMKKYNFLFLGSYFSSALKIIKKFIRTDKLFFLDDGAATLRAQEAISQGLAKPVNWFSFFQMTSVINQEIIYHNFKYIKTKLKYSNPENYYFIGQPIEHMLGVSESEYINNLMAICNSLNTTLFYIPHRIESKSFLDKIEKIENLKLNPCNMPVEVYFLFILKKPPMHIYSFYSSALISLSHLYPESNFTAIKPKIIDSQIIPVYTFLKNMNIFIKNSDL